MGRFFPLRPGLLFGGLLLILFLRMPTLQSSAWVNLGSISFGRSSYRKYDLEKLKLALRADPHNLRALYLTGYSYFLNSDYTASIDYLSEAEQNEVSPADPLTALHLGKAFYQAGDVSKARGIWKRADLYQKVTHRANLLQSFGKFEDSLADYQLALEMEPGSVDSLTGAAQNLQSLGRYSEAAAILKEALQSDPDSLLAHLLLVTSYVQMGELGAAAEWDERTAALLPENEAHLYLGRAAIWRDQIPKAIQEITLYLRYYPENPYAYELLCFNYPRVEDIPAAINACQRWIQLKPAPLPENYVYLGDLYLKINDKEAARKAYEDALQIDPTNEEAVNHLSRISH